MHFKVNPRIALVKSAFPASKIFQTNISTRMKIKFLKAAASGNTGDTDRWPLDLIFYSVRFSIQLGQIA
jgi:hypothetical protein